jgi:hypothetical protein
LAELDEELRLVYLCADINICENGGSLWLSRRTYENGGVQEARVCCIGYDEVAGSWSVWRVFNHGLESEELQTERQNILTNDDMLTAIAACVRYFDTSHSVPKEMQIAEQRQQRPKPSIVSDIRFSIWLWFYRLFR